MSSFVVRLIMLILLANYTTMVRTELVEFDSCMDRADYVDYMDYCAPGNSDVFNALYYPVGSPTADSCRKAYCEAEHLSFGTKASEKFVARLFTACTVIVAIWLAVSIVALVAGCAGGVDEQKAEIAKLMSGSPSSRPPVVMATAVVVGGRGPLVAEATVVQPGSVTMGTAVTVHASPLSP
jgi:hypothetical protein